MAAVIDSSSELVILQLLADDLVAISHAQEAELLDNASACPESESKTPASSVALKMLMSDMQVAHDHLYADAMQSEDASALAINWQYAQKLAAAERKACLDREFATKLQSLIDEDDGCSDAHDADR